MPCFEESRIIRCSSERLFDTVMDIDAYPEFLPWVADARVLNRYDGELTAELVANLGGFHHSFRTTDRFIRPKLIEIRLLEGPFRSLESLWTFEDLNEDQCRAHFSIDFEFSSHLLSLVAAPIFSSACRMMVHSFEKRVLNL